MQGYNPLALKVCEIVNPTLGPGPGHFHHLIFNYETGF